MFLTLTLSFHLEATVFVQSILLSSNVVDIPMDDELRGDLACSVAEGSCSFCDAEAAEEKCPEWTDEDVKIGKHRINHHGYVPFCRGVATHQHDLSTMSNSFANAIEIECCSCCDIHDLFGRSVAFRFHPSQAHFTLSDRLCLKGV